MHAAVQSENGQAMGIHDHDFHPNSISVFSKGLPQAVATAFEKECKHSSRRDGSLDQQEQLHRDRETHEQTLEQDAFAARIYNRKIAYNADLRSISRCGLGKICLTVAPPKNGPDNRHIKIWQADKIAFGGRTVDGDMTVSDTALRCKNPALCPVCAPQRATERAEVLKPQIRKFIDPESYFARREIERQTQGSRYREDPGQDFNPGMRHDVFMVTLTASHCREDDCKLLLDKQSAAFRRATDGMKKHHRRVGLSAVSYVVGLDATDSLKTGFHNHLHGLLLVPISHDDMRPTIDSAEELITRWMEACEDEGLSCDRAGQHIIQAVRAPRAEGDEIDVEALDALVDYAVRMSLPAEVVGGAGKSKTKGIYSMPPMQHLYLAADDGLPMKERAFHEQRWRTYMAAMANRKIVRVTRGIALKPVKGHVPPVEKLIALPDHFSRVLDGRKAWRALETALVQAYEPSSEPVDLKCIVRTLQKSGIWLPEDEILKEISPRETRLPHDMPQGFVPEAPLASIPRGEELVELSRRRINEFVEWAGRPGSGWDPNALWDWFERQIERLESYSQTHANETEPCHEPTSVDEDDDCLIEDF